MGYAVARLRARRGRALLTAGGIAAAAAMPGGRGYAVVAGRDISGRPGEAVIERGLAEAWHIGPGDTIHFRTSGNDIRVGTARVVGVAVAPDDVAYPLASAPRIWMPYDLVR